jgi:23S rRNA (adenine2503-C2)-methyltransferase
MGLDRNLETWEIVEQVRVLRGTLASGERIHGVVFQGMGEPLANIDRVIEAVRVVSDPSALAIDARAITICTAGLPSGIRRLARELPKVRLAISIATARPELRRKLMPIENRYPLPEVLDAAADHARATGLAPMWAVTPLGGVNDGNDDARALADLWQSFARTSGVRPRVSVVPYNSLGPTPEADPFERGDVAAYMALLVAHGIRPHLRYSGGSDIDAACGQLAGRG